MFDIKNFTFKDNSVLCTTALQYLVSMQYLCGLMTR